MLTKFAEIAERIKDQIALGAEPKDCKTANDLIEVLQRWTSINCPIAQPPEPIEITEPTEK